MLLILKPLHLQNIEDKVFEDWNEDYKEKSNAWNSGKHSEW